MPWWTASPGGALLLDTVVYTGGEDAIADFTINRRSTETIDVTALERTADELARMRMPTADGGTATWAAGDTSVTIDPTRVETAFVFRPAIPPSAGGAPAALLGFHDMDPAIPAISP